MEENGEGRRGPAPWRAWILTIVAAILLSIATSVLLSGTLPFRWPWGADAARCGGGCPAEVHR